MPDIEQQIPQEPVSEIQSETPPPTVQPEPISEPPSPAPTQEKLETPQTSNPPTPSSPQPSFPSTDSSPSPQVSSQTSQSFGEQVGKTKSFLSKALASIQFRKKAKLEKIIRLANQKKSITNDQVQKLLRVSDATATRYLSELVRQNRLKRVGTTSSTRYEPFNSVQD